MNLLRQKQTGYFLEMIALYYLSLNHPDFSLKSRSIDMIFPSPLFQPYSFHDEDSKESFEKFLRALDENGEIEFDLRQVKHLLQTDAYRFINHKLESRKFDFMKFFERNLSKSCRSLKSICRIQIKLNIQHYPHDIKQLTLIPGLTDHLERYLIYENKFTFDSNV